MSRHTESVEVVVKDQRRRRWSLAEKAALVRRTYEPGMSVSLVARQEGVSAGLLFQWRKLERQGALTAVSAGEAVVPASELAAARAEIASSSACSARRPWRMKSSRKPWSTPPKKVDCALALVARGRLVKTVCRTMGMARSHVRDLLVRDDAWTDGRRHRTPCGDAQLLAELRQEIAQLPSYGYRRACALVNRQRAARGAPRVNAKRVYRVMAGAGLLLPKPHADASPHASTRAVWRSRAATCGGAPTVWKSSATPARP